MRQSQCDPVIMGTLRSLRSFPSCDRRWEWPLLSPEKWFKCHGGRGTMSAVFGIGVLEFFEWERVPRTCGRISGPRAGEECCYAAHAKRKICFVWSGSRPAQKKGPSDLVGGPVRVRARRELVPMIRELLPKNRNWEEWIPVQVHRGRPFARRRREWTTT